MSTRVVDLHSRSAPRKRRSIRQRRQANMQNLPRLSVLSRSTVGKRIYPIAYWLYPLTSNFLSDFDEGHFSVFPKTSSIINESIQCHLIGLLHPHYGNCMFSESDHSGPDYSKENDRRDSQWLSSVPRTYIGTSVTLVVLWALSFSSYDDQM